MIEIHGACAVATVYKGLLEVLKNYCKRAIEYNTGVYIDL